MKKLLITIACLCSLQFVFAKKTTVTSSTDNLTSPTSGMLRYILSKAAYGDTIVFNVKLVTLAGEIDLDGNSVVIDGSSQGRVFLNANGKGRVFSVSAYFSTNKYVLKNLVIANGYVSKEYGSGGGIYAFISGGDLTMENCIFQNNVANASQDGQGGALRTNGGTFTNCQFYFNKVTGTAGPQGGGAVQAVSGTFINCVFTGNSAKWGGGIYATSGSTIYNCTFTNNKATSESAAGGIQSEGAEIINCIAYNNTVNGSASNIIASFDDVIKNSAFESGNSLVGTNGNIGLSTSPFKGGPNADSLSLVQGSTCINSGTTTGVTILNLDLAGNKRIEGATVDMGALEYNTLTGNFAKNETTTSYLFPNPSNGVLYFNKATLKDQVSSIEAYDMAGNLILNQKAVSVDKIELQKAGVYQVILRTNSAIYHQKVIIY